MKKIIVDYEFEAEAFWSAARETAEGENAEIVARFGERDVLELEDAAAELFVAWCRTVPGFADGPEHAREALIVRDARVG